MLIEDIDRGSRHIGKLFVFDEQGRGILEQRDIQMIVLALTVDDANQLIKTLQAFSARARKKFAHAIERGCVADKNLQIAAGSLGGNGEWDLLNEGSAAIGAQQNFDANRFAGLSFAFVAPSAIDCGPAVLGTTGDVEGDLF